jgi:hypothetical protein
MGAEFWQAVVIEAIKAAAVITAAALTVFVPLWRRLGRIRQDAEHARKDAKQAREQVKNDHGTNLRDDLDDLHEDVRELRGYAAENRKAAREAAELGVANQQAIGAVAVEVRRLVQAVESGGPLRRRWWRR